MSYVLTQRLFASAFGGVEVSEAGTEEVAKLGRRLLKCDVPWVRSNRLGAELNEIFSDPIPYFNTDHDQSLRSVKTRSFSPDELFGAFCLIAVRSELCRNSRQRHSERGFRAIQYSKLVFGCSDGVCQVHTDEPIKVDQIRQSLWIRCSSD